MKSWFGFGRQFDLRQQLSVPSELCMYRDSVIGRGWGRIGGRHLRARCRNRQNRSHLNQTSARHRHNAIIGSLGWITLRDATVLEKESAERELT